MTQSHIQIGFSADAEDLLDGLAKIQQSLKKATAEISALSAESRKAARSAGEGLTASLTSAGEAARNAAASSRSLTEALAAHDTGGRTGSAKASSEAILRADAELNEKKLAQDQGAADASAALDRRSVDQQIAALRMGLREQEALLAIGVARRRITNEQRASALKAETDSEYRAELALLEKERSLGELKFAQEQALDLRILQLRERHAEAAARAEQRSILQSQRTWSSYFGVVEGAFNSHLRDLLSGATTWARMFKAILSGLIIHFIEMCERMALQWAASELAQTAASRTGAAARMSAATGAAAASSMGAVSAALHSIAASAAETFAGIFGFLSPVMGPAAAGPAAAGQATVLAAAGGLSAFAQGSWQLPSDMIAQVHKGEMIVPAAQTPWAQSLMANASRASAPGGDVHVHHATHFNVTAMDSNDVKRWIAGNGKTILQSIHQSVRHGAHLGLSKWGA